MKKGTCYSSHYKETGVKDYNKSHHVDKNGIQNPPCGSESDTTLKKLSRKGECDTNQKANI